MSDNFFKLLDKKMDEKVDQNFAKEFFDKFSKVEKYQKRGFFFSPLKSAAVFASLALVLFVFININREQKSDLAFNMEEIDSFNVSLREDLNAVSDIEIFSDEFFFDFEMDLEDELDEDLYALIFDELENNSDELYDEIDFEYIDNYSTLLKRNFRRA